MWQSPSDLLLIVCLLNGNMQENDGILCTGGIAMTEEVRLTTLAKTSG